ncbi:DEAD/DEAH box helicase family protein [Helicobacter sp. 11S03491-1]|uniref:DEAD/DEAH box helicase family protein n=1 Tax=Helicobacter sp. 11S03491-1 TaxID=1476196 RepID=UPI000BA7A834|nr:DEAD/DEAH box helicase family protein [Helicobacter sp. 11S03491-1]PAF43393.1 DEAD/DEAH box helicase [Helicobacter sp. 11S03491-1]
MEKLHDELKIALEYGNVEIPLHISENLNKELREYQKNALKYFLLQRKKPKTNHLMFHMATGSGKTVIMAALMLDCFSRGYRNFVFFVNSTAIVEKTKANFVDKNSSKYLFEDRIIIDGKNVAINVINNLNESKQDCMNIYFTTIQSLFALFSCERENALTLQDLINKKLVFLADEAHHLNAETKKINKKEKEEKKDWESVVKKAYESNKENLLLEFSATIPKDKNVPEKYKDKIVYEYDLAKFCKDGYSKRIFVIKYENSKIEYRFLGAMLLSLFRELLAQKYAIFLKPVILFKSEAIAASKTNQNLFLSFLDTLDPYVVEEFYKHAILEGSELFKKSLEFFREEFGDTFLEKITNFLKCNFKKAYTINVNDNNDLENKQMLLNSLENPNNRIRVIFAVDKLNEGWDVLNLFDIVRLGNVKSKIATTKEAQLIGRGARYYPFEDREKIGAKNKRKFDKDLENDLSILERLSYHTLNEVAFIKNLNESMMDEGLILEDSRQRVALKLNPNVEQIMQKYKIYYAKNNRIKKKDLSYFEITKKELDQKIRTLKIPLFSNDIQEVEEKFEKIKEEEESGIFAKIGKRVDVKYFLKAMNILGLSFEDLSKCFDTLPSKHEFVQKYLGEIDVCFSKKQIFSEENNLEIAKFIIENFKEIKQTIKSEYEITPFQAEELIGKDRVIYTIKEVETKSYDWLYYHQCRFDSDLEKEFLKFIEGNKQKISEIFSQWFLIRNDGFEEFKIYDNREGESTYGMGFEPDFIFFGKKKAEEKKFLSIECFIEVKGDHLSGDNKGDEKSATEGVDTWKERFLEILKNQEVSTKINETLTLFSLPFFRKKHNEKFVDAFFRFLN